MSNDNLPVSPLGSIISKLAAKKEIENPYTKLKKRQQGTSGRKVVLCDLSSSMRDFVATARQSKIEMLKTALLDVVAAHPDIIIFGFSDMAELIRKEDIPNITTWGSTALDVGLDAIRRYHPSKTIIISDGQPNNTVSALAAAENITGTIDVIFCGPETDQNALLFMSSLTKNCGGEVINWDLDLKPALGMPVRNPIRGLLE